MTWDENFTEIFSRCEKAYEAGAFDYEKSYTNEELSFMKSIGCQPREFFDFIEDFVDEKVPAPSTALLVAAVRRDYFIVEQQAKFSSEVILRDELPGFGDELEGYVYLPRILKKARGKLRGELDPDIMYGCGGDRNFLKKNGGIHPADFLRRVWAAGDDDSKIVSWLKSLAERS